MSFPEPVVEKSEQSFVVLPPGVVNPWLPGEDGLEGRETQSTTTADGKGDSGGDVNS